MNQLLLGAIALTATGVVRAEALQIVMHRVLSTPQMAAIVTQWEGRWQLFMCHCRWVRGGHLTLVVR